MIKSIKQTCLLTLFTAFLSCSGAENADQHSIIKGKKSRSKQSQIRFYNDPQLRYRDLHPESATPKDRYSARIKAEAKHQSKAREKTIQSKRAILKQDSIKEKNEEWKNYELPPDYEPIELFSHLSFPERIDALTRQDQQERAEKLNTISEVREIDQELLTGEEKLAKRKEFSIVSQPILPTSLFIALDSSSIDQLRPMLSERLKYLHKYSSKEMHILLTFIITSLINDNIAAMRKTIDEDIKIHIVKKIKRLEAVVHADLNTQQKELGHHNAFDTKTFKQFLQRYLDENDYSFAKKMPTVPLSKTDIV